MKLEITGYLAENMDAPHGIALHGSVSAKQLAQAIASDQLRIDEYQRERRSPVTTVISRHGAT